MYIKIFKKIDIHVLLAVILILAAVALRVILAIIRWPIADSDESIIQLMALHINNMGEHPIFFYGQYYMGTLEGYVGAVWFRLFGASVLTIRLAMISFFAIFLVGLYMLTSRLYSRKFALLTLALFIFGTSKMIERQIGTIGGYTEILPLAVFLLLVSYFLAVSEQPKNRSKQILLYALWGFLAGLALWSDLLIAPYVLIAGILITLFCWKEILKWGIWLLLLGFCIGAFPLIYYNLTATPGTDSWTTFASLNNMGIGAQDNLWYHISKTLLVSMPVITGLQPQQFITAWPSFTPHAFLYRILQMGWSAGYLLLLCLSLLVGLLMLKSARKSQASRQAYIQSTLHLLLVLAAFLTIILFIKGGTTNIDALNGARYLLIIWISTPAVLWPLWRGITEIRHSQKLHLTLTACRVGIILLIFCVFFVSTLSIFAGVASAQQTRQNTTLLTQKLEDLHITRFFSEYWTCYPLIFASQEKLICANTNPVLQHGYDRYQPYRAAVMQTENPAFVYPADSSNLTDLEHALKTTHTPYHSITYQGYVIIQPARPIPGVPLYQP